MNILRTVHICGQNTSFLFTENTNRKLPAPLICGLWRRFLIAMSPDAALLGLLAKLQKSDYYLRHVCLSVRPSVRMEQLCSHWMDFHVI